MADNNKLSGKPIDSTLLKTALDSGRISMGEYLELLPQAIRERETSLINEMHKPLMYDEAGEDNRGLGFKELWDDGN